MSTSRGLPTEWPELVQAHDDRAVAQASPDELPPIDIHSLLNASARALGSRLRPR